MGHGNLIFARSTRANETLWGYLFMLPWIVSFLLFFTYPFLSGLKSSFLKLSLFTPERSRFVALSNYADLLRDGLFWKSIFNVAYNQVIFIPLSIGCALLAAFLITEVRRGALLYKMCYYMPLIVSMTVASLVFMELTGIHGPLQRLLVRAGIQKDYLSLGQMRWQAMPILALFNTWKWFGIMMIYFIAGLAGIDTAILEAAVIDGAGWRVAALKVRLPLLRPQIFFFVTMNVINGLQMFGEVLILFTTSGGMYKQGMTPILMLYTQAFSYDNMSYAATIGIVMSVLIFVVSQAQMRLMGEGSRQ
jgi:ABC-type sugar transport system permease subunit